MLALLPFAGVLLISADVLLGKTNVHVGEAEPAAPTVSKTAKTNRITSYDGVLRYVFLQWSLWAVAQLSPAFDKDSFEREEGEHWLC